MRVLIRSASHVTECPKKRCSNMTSKKKSHGSTSLLKLNEYKAPLLLLVLGVGSIITMFAITNSQIKGPSTDILPDYPTTFPEYLPSGSNPNMTRDGYTVTLSTKTQDVLAMFDPAGRGNTSLWGLHVDQMRVVYYGVDNQWHETSFQINEKGYRWILDGSEEYMNPNRQGAFTAGERRNHILENMRWGLGYVPSRFYPDLKNYFWPDAPNANKGGVQGGLLPYEGNANMMNNWPEFHQTIALQAWATPATTSQVRGAVDYDDEIVFIAKNGRKVETSLWYRQDLWNHRWEVAIVDPVDGGQTWMYIYFNPSTYATAPTPANQISNDYYRELSFIAPGETDQVSWDPNNYQITSTTYDMKMNPTNAFQFTDLKITLPGMMQTDMLQEFPKEFIWADGSIELGGNTPYSAVQQGIVLKTRIEGTWYQLGPPGLAAGQLTTYPGGGYQQRSYDDYNTHVGVIYHHGNPEQTTHPAYGEAPATTQNLGWKDPADNNKDPRWWDFSGTSYPTSTTAGAIAIRNRWTRIDGTPATFGDYTGYSWKDSAMYVYWGGSWQLILNPYQPNLVLDGGAFNDKAATIDGPVMVYVERIGCLKATWPLEWFRQIDVDYISLFSGDANPNDGLVMNFDFFKQNDIVALPNRFEIRNNTYPIVNLPPEIPQIGGSLWHIQGFFNGFMVPSTINVNTKLYLGGGATTSDYMCMNLLLNQTWVQARNFPYYHHIQQLGTDGLTPVMYDYGMWNWSTSVTLAPVGHWPKTLTYNSNEADDLATGYTPQSTQDAFTGDYHPWWDSSGTTIQYREQWQGTPSWRTEVRAHGESVNVAYQMIPTVPRQIAGRNVMPDWAILSVPNAGDVWVYMPVREIHELKSDVSGTFQPDVGIADDSALFFKDSGAEEPVKEFGLFARRLTNGGSVIPFDMVLVFGNMGITSPADANMKGKREWVRNRIKLDSLFFVTYQSLEHPIVERFGPVPSSKLFYRAGDDVFLELITNWATSLNTSQISFDGINYTSLSSITRTDAGSGMYRYAFSFRWISGSDGDNVGPSLGTRHDYYWVHVQIGSQMVTCGLFLDNTPPSAAQFSLPATTSSPVVLLDWSASRGVDNSDGTFPYPDNSGIAEYIVNRNGMDIAWIPRGTSFTYIDDNGGNGFSDGTMLYYRLKTVDRAGNAAIYPAAGNIVTMIDKPFDPIGRWNSTGIVRAANRNYQLGWNQYPHAASITSFTILRSTSITGGYAQIPGMPLGDVTSFTTTDFASTTDDTYYYILRSSDGTNTADSAPVTVIHDRASPMSPAINWPYGSTYAPTSMSIPIDCTGSSQAVDPGFIGNGDPANIGSGISHYLIYRRVNTGMGWTPVFELRGNVSASLMASNVFYDNDPYMADGYQYSYKVRAVDYASNWADSPVINFTYICTGPPPPSLQIQYVQASTSRVAIGESFTVSVQVANVGGTAATINAVNLTMILGGMNVLSQYAIGSPSPALPTSLSPGNATMVSFSVQPLVSACLGNVLIFANCTWNGGNFTEFDGPPAEVLVVSSGMHADFQHVPEIAMINQTINFTDTSFTLGQNITSWEWIFGDGSPPVLTPSASHAYGAAGQFNMWLSIVVNYNMQLTHNETIIVLNQSADDDADGLTNEWELQNGLDPLSNDTDADGLIDGLEVLTYNTNATCNDTDADGLLDGLEVLTYNTNATCNDTDADGLLDGLEVLTYHTNATCNDTDADGLLDYAEVFTYNTNPCSNDTDADDLLDIDELFVYMTNATCNDTDADGLLDGNELFVYLTNATCNDTDADGLADGLEILTYHTNATCSDTDADSLPDGLEILTYHTNATCNDTDADSLPDGLEIFTYHTNATCNDTDADSLLDGMEVLVFNTNPCANDSDTDGLLDADELFVYMTNATCNDTDADSLLDADELFIYMTNATCNDTDADGLTDGLEILIYYTNATCNDTDDDGLLDGAEVFTHHTDPCLNDTDGDGLRDGDEIMFYTTNPTLNDTDNDGLLDGFEVHVVGSNPLNADTDGDGLTDGLEVLTYHTDAMRVDTDSDSLTDGFEVYICHTNPCSNDTDADTLLDGDEVNTYHTDPCLNDTDADDLLDADELFVYMTNATCNDTDADGLSDGLEIRTYHTNATCNDTDADGLLDGNEIFIYQTNVTCNDTDGDGLLDGSEVFTHHTNPCSNDTDTDGLADGLEITLIGSNPLLADTDGDGLADGDEYLVHHTNPLAADTDADGMPDKWELDSGLDPLINDADSDADMDELINVQEYLAGADPWNPDTDGDGMPDGWEHAHGLAVCIDDSQNDPDQDGLTNIDEFHRGCDPKNPDTDGDAFFDGTEVLWNTNPLDPNSTPLSYILIVIGAITILAAAGVVTTSRKGIKKGDRLHGTMLALVSRLEAMLKTGNVLGAFPVAKEIDDCFGQLSALPAIVSLQSRFRSLKPVISRHFDTLLMKARTDAIEIAQAISLKVNEGDIVGAMKLVAMIKDLLVAVHWLGGSVDDIEGRLKPDLDWVRWARENKMDQLAKELEEIKADQGLDRTARLIRISKLQRDAAKAGIVDNTKAGTTEDAQKGLKNQKPHT